jgi:hypothetical protein
MRGTLGWPTHRARNQAETLPCVQREREKYWVSLAPARQATRVVSPYCRRTADDGSNNQRSRRYTHNPSVQQFGLFGFQASSDKHLRSHFQMGASQRKLVNVNSQHPGIGWQENLVSSAHWEAKLKSRDFLEVAVAYGLILGSSQRPQPRQTMRAHSAFDPQDRGDRSGLSVSPSWPRASRSGSQRRSIPCIRCPLAWQKSPEPGGTSCGHLYSNS